MSSAAVPPTAASDVLDTSSVLAQGCDRERPGISFPDRHKSIDRSARLERALVVAQNARRRREANDTHAAYVGHAFGAANERLGRPGGRPQLWHARAHNLREGTSWEPAIAEAQATVADARGDIADAGERMLAAVDRVARAGPPLTRPATGSLTARPGGPVVCERLCRG